MNCGSSTNSPPEAPQRRLHERLTTIANNLPGKKKLAKTSLKTNGNDVNSTKPTSPKSRRKHPYLRAIPGEIMPSPTEVDAEGVEVRYNSLEHKRKRDETNAHETPDSKKLLRYPAIRLPFPLSNTLARLDSPPDYTEFEESEYRPSTGRLSHCCVADDLGSGTTFLDEIVYRPLSDTEEPLLTTDNDESEESNESDEGYESGDSDESNDDKIDEDDKSDYDHKSLKSDDIHVKATQSPKYLKHPERVPKAKKLQHTIDRAIDIFYGCWDRRLPKYHVKVDLKLTERRVWTSKEDGKTTLRLKTRKKQ